MASITNYTTLVEAIVAVTEDDGAEFAAYIPTAVDLAEERLFRELDLPELEEKAQGNMVTGNGIITKPTGYEFAEFFSYTPTGSQRVVLKKKLESYIQDYWPNFSTTGEPKYYCDVNETQFRVAPTPAANYTYEIKYTQKPTKLGTSNENNYFVDNCNDVLFNATMVEIVKFMKAWSQIPVWEGTYTNVRDTWNLEMARYRRDGSTVPLNPEGNLNSIKHTINTNA